MNKEELKEKRNRTIETIDDIKAVLGLDELYIDELEKACDETQKLLDKQIEATFKLDKENAELKRDKEDLIFIRNQNAKCMCEDKNQLIKAKDLLKYWLQTSKASGCDNVNIVTDTEQFLKEMEK